MNGRVGGSAADLQHLLRRPRASSQDLNFLAASSWQAEESWDAERGRRSSGGGSGGGSARASPRAPPSVAARLGWRQALSAALSLTLCLVLLSKHRSLYRNGQDAVAALYYGLDPGMLGRSEAAHPAPRCCRDEACARPRGGGGRVAVVTYLRDDGYAPLLQQLDCTLRRSNPGLELGLMAVEGELGGATLELAAALNITLLPVEPLGFRNTYEPRYGRNWLKVRALGLTQYDAVLLVDADVAVAGALGPLFSLPFEFAAVWDQSRWLNRFRTAVTGINGGVFLLRPCAAVERHMLALLAARPKLRFTHGTAEQQFFGWYYRYTGAVLPLQYNCQAEQSLDDEGLTVGGVPPKIVHFTHNKPFRGPQLGSPGHQYLCSLDELERRAAGPAADNAAPAAAAGGGQPQAAGAGQAPPAEQAGPREAGGQRGAAPAGAAADHGHRLLAQPSALVRQGNKALP